MRDHFTHNTDARQTHHLEDTKKYTSQSNAQTILRGNSIILGTKNRFCLFFTIFESIEVRRILTATQNLFLKTLCTENVQVVLRP